MSEARIGIRTDTKQAEAGIKSVKGLFAGLQAEAKKSILTGVGLAGGVAAFAAVAGAARAAIGYAGDAIQKASDLAETQSKVKVVFGDSAKVIERMGRTSAAALGMSTNAALTAAGVYGNLFRAMGLTETKSAEMSTGLVQLAADLASFNNMDPTIVLDKLRAGLSGEVEPLRTLGVNLNMARIRTKALELGLADATGELTAAAKAQATYALIVEDTTLAQGDFERTSDGLANTQRALAAEMENVQTKIGEKLLPIMLQLATFAKDVLVPGLQAVVDAMDELGGAIVDERAAAGIDRLFAKFSGRPIANWAKENIGGVRQLSGVIQTEMRTMADRVGQNLALARQSAIAFATRLPGEIATALREGREGWKAALAQLGTDLENEMSREAQIAELKGALTSQKMIDGWASKDPLVRAQTAATAAIINEELRKLQTNIGAHGINIGVAWAAGVKTGVTRSLEGMRQALVPYYNLLQGKSPPKEGPLKDIDIGGYNIGAAWAKGFGKGIGTANLNLAIPGLTSGAPAPAFAMAGGGGSPVVIQIMLNDRVLAEAVDRQLYYAGSGSSRFPRG